MQKIQNHIPFKRYCLAKSLNFVAKYTKQITSHLHCIETVKGKILKREGGADYQSFLNDY
uniref:Uncharacterized protein n=1 Tax=Rhizophora mucronata TaxID=61149 RepID=A0A2P2M6D5_RHIMU